MSVAQWDAVFAHMTGPIRSRHVVVHRLEGQGRQQSLTSEMKLPPESDTESIADYADGNDGGNCILALRILRILFKF